MTRRRGSPNKQAIVRTPELFWARVKKGPSCWEWIGAREAAGYGFFLERSWYDDRNKRHPVWKKAHRHSWEMANGPIPDNLIICHRCDNPPCVRPDHLFLGTHLDNSKDCTTKGRLNDRHGSRNPNVKISASDVVAIRRAYKAGGKTQQALADEYGIPQPHVSRIVLGQAWANSSLKGRIDNGERK